MSINVEDLSPFCALIHNSRSHRLGLLAQLEPISAAFVQCVRHAKQYINNELMGQLPYSHNTIRLSNREICRKTKEMEWNDNPARL